MLQNMLITALTPLNLKTEANDWENRPFRSVWPEQPQQKPTDISRTIKKKPKRVRTAFSSEQIRVLEKTFCHSKYVNSFERLELAKSLNIHEKCIKTWFQNRRMKEKRESSESSCDSSSDSNGTESPPVSFTPPLQVNPEASKTLYASENLSSNDPEYSYQLPPYYEVPHNVYGMQTPNFPAFYNDNNVYPTQYYPVGLSYPYVGSNGGNNDYGSEVNHFWAPNHNAYFTPT